MKRILITATLLALGALTGLSAEDLPLEPGFVRLDNGKDLTGWTNKGGDWSVVDGAIHLEYNAPPRGGSLLSERSRPCGGRLARGRRDAMVTIAQAIGLRLRWASSNKENYHDPQAT